MAMSREVIAQAVSSGQIPPDCTPLDADIREHYRDMSIHWYGKVPTAEEMAAWNTFADIKAYCAANLDLLRFRLMPKPNTKVH